MHAGNNFVNDGGRVFVARVVAGDDHHVGELFGNAPHQRALAAIAVAAATKYAKQFSLCVLAQCLQNFFERVRGVRVVHNYQRLAGAAEAFHASGHRLRLRKARGGLGQWHAAYQQHRQHREQIGGIETPEQRAAQ